MLTITKIDSFEELMKLNSIWNALLEKSDIEPTFLNFEWISEWWKCFGDDKKLFILLVKENDKIIGIAPLMITIIKRFGLSLNKIEFIGMPLSDYSDFIISEKNREVLQKIYGFLSENKRLWNFIRLKSIPETSLTLDQSKKIFYSKKLFNVFLSDVCPSFIFDDDWALLRKKMNSKRMIKRIGYFKRMGELSFLSCNGNTQEALKLLNIFFEQHKQKWNATSTPSMFNNDCYKKFFVNLTTSLLQKNELDIFYLKFNQKPIALQFTFLYDNRLLAYSSSYDMSYAKRSPGKILLKFLLEYCASENFKEYDFLKGGEKYKSTFTNTTKQNFGISIHKNVFLYMLDCLSNKIENKIKKNDKLYNLFIKYEKKLRIF